MEKRDRERDKENPSLERCWRKKAKTLEDVDEKLKSWLLKDVSQMETCVCRGGGEGGRLKRCLSLSLLYLLSSLFRLYLNPPFSSLLFLFLF